MLEKLIQLAREWRDFSKSVSGLLNEEYVDGDVDCYFSSDGFTSVTFIIKKWSGCNDRLSIAFHSIPVVSGFTVRSAEFIAEAYAKYAEDLKQIKIEYSKRDKAEVEKERSKKINSLKQELASLEEG